MREFSYVRVTSADDALERLSQGKSRILAGGTDLVPLMKDEIASPSQIIDISGWQAGCGIAEEDGSLRIGALTPLSDIAAHTLVSEWYTVLAEACQAAATPQLRNMGTIGGNLLQDTRCWYYRGPYDCWLKGGRVCYARDGENEYHAVFSTDPSKSMCVSAHPSDPAAALLAFDARVRWKRRGEEQEVSLEELYALPDSSRRRFTLLPADALITDIILPNIRMGTRSTYLKAMPRASWAFALAGVAIALYPQGSSVENVRVALTGVAPIPIRAHEVERRLTGRAATEIDWPAVDAALVAGAQPLPQNSYKLDLLRGLFREGIERLLSV